MQCPKCSAVIPEDSEFCPFCGTDIKKELAAIAAAARPEIQEEASGGGKAGKKMSRTPFLITLIAAIVLVIGLAGLNVVQYLGSTEKDASIEKPEGQVDALNDSISFLRDENETLQSNISSLETENRGLQSTSDAMSDYIGELQRHINYLEYRLGLYE